MTRKQSHRHLLSDIIVYSLVAFLVALLGMYSLFAIIRPSSFAIISNIFVAPSIIITTFIATIIITYFIGRNTLKQFKKLQIRQAMKGDYSHVKDF
jgi:ABC-type antimicrobial peptide transport system permease subunit